LAHPKLVQLGELVTTKRVPVFTMSLVHGHLSGSMLKVWLSCTPMAWCIGTSSLRTSS
jgi:hypothetical protein